MKRITVEEAQTLLLKERAGRMRTERLPLRAAGGRILAEKIYAGIAHPPFPRSPVDGFAVRHDDTENASPKEPAVLSLRQCVCAGDWPEREVEPGEAARVMTGAPIPGGADCVARQEGAKVEDDTVKVFAPCRKYENYCFLGEDVERGTCLAEPGTRLDAVWLGILSGQGIREVSVFQKPRVGIFSTGSELSWPESGLVPGKIYDSNGPMLEQRVRELGAEPVYYGIIPDDEKRLAAAISNALGVCDFIITSGGVSVGLRDCMPSVGEQLGARLLFHGIAAKPGSPAMALKKDNTLILCLSGNPFAAYVGFELLASPVVEAMGGYADLMDSGHTGPMNSGYMSPMNIRRKGIMAAEFRKKSSVRRFVRAYFEDGHVSFPSGGHSSGMLCSLADCNCLIDIPAGNNGLKPGDDVEILLLRGKAGL